MPVLAAAAGTGAGSHHVPSTCHGPEVVLDTRKLYGAAVALGAGAGCRYVLRKFPGPQ